MQVNKFEIEGVLEFIPRVFEDERGYFFESYSKRAFDEYLPGIDFVQDNQSFSTKGTVRGLHFQREPFAQGKLVRVITGRALDVLVDLREGSKTFGKHLTIELIAEKQNLVYVPVGFAHGFSALEDVIFSYKCTGLYDKSSEGGVIWNDPDLAINWQVQNPNVSEKDLELPSFNSVLPF